MTQWVMHYRLLFKLPLTWKTVKTVPKVLFPPQMRKLIACIEIMKLCSKNKFVTIFKKSVWFVSYLYEKYQNHPIVLILQRCIHTTYWFISSSKLVITIDITFPYFYYTFKKNHNKCFIVLDNYVFLYYLTFP